MIWIVHSRKSPAGSIKSLFVSQEAGIKPMDKLRLALVYLLTTTTLPSDAEFDRIEKTIEGDVGDSLSALRQVPLLHTGLEAILFHSHACDAGETSLARFCPFPFSSQTCCLDFLQELVPTCIQSMPEVSSLVPIPQLCLLMCPFPRRESLNRIKH